MGVEIPEALKLNRDIILVNPIDEDIDGFHSGDIKVSSQGMMMDRSDESNTNVKFFLWMRIVA